MKLPLAIGVALAAITVAAASAHTSYSRTVIHHGPGARADIDANSDGWVTRAEASAAVDRAFETIDANDDGRLDDADRAAHLAEHNIRVEELEGGRVRIFRDGEEVEIDREIERAHARAERDAERAERDAERAEREAERAERHAERELEGREREIERHVERRIERDGDVIVIHRSGEDGEWEHAIPMPPMPPVPAIAPHPPMFMMLIANSEEADLNDDGSLSREEFRNQHLRFFDAGDANGDGRVRFEAPPEPPAPPVAPTPPEPPRRR